VVDVLVCVKRVPDVSGQVLLTADEQTVDGRYVGFTVSNHENAAVELAIRAAEATGGTVTLLTVGTAEAVEQLRATLALGCHAAIHVEAEPSTLGPADVAREIAHVVQEKEQAGTAYDLILLGNDAADTGDFQVGIRLAYVLGRPVVGGISTVEVTDGTLVATGAGPDGEDTYSLPLPAVVAVMEGGAEPRYPTLKGRMAAKKIEIETRPVSGDPAGPHRIKLSLPPPQPSTAEVLGEGPDSAKVVVDLLEKLGVTR
jgi:electron transfer flavoprotein beta subunit